MKNNLTVLSDKILLSDGGDVTHCKSVQKKGGVQGPTLHIFAFRYRLSYKAMSTTIITSGQFYHVYNRGNQRQELFKDERDYIRFLFLLLHLQAPITFRNLERQVTYFQKQGQFKTSEKNTQDIIKRRQVDLVGFCIMPNHFHLCIQSHSDTGVSEYLHRIGTAYGMYFNKKYKLSGHVFQGKYKAKLIDDDNSLIRVSAYIHQNPWELKLIDDYPWSSLQDYQNNRWGDLLQNSFIMERFKSFTDYLIEVEEVHRNKLIREQFTAEFKQK